MSNILSYNYALAVVTFCIASFWFGSLLRIKIPEYLLSDGAINAGRFAALPLIAVTAIVMSLMLFTARASFDAKQALIEDIAGSSLQLDKALTYYGTKEALAAQKDFRDYIDYLVEHPDTFLKGVDRQKAEPFAAEIQSLAIPKSDPGIAALTKRFMAELMGKISLDRFKLATKTSQVIYPFSLNLLILWLVVLFLFIGVTSPPLNFPAFLFSVVVAACVGSISFLIVEYQNSSAGFIRLNDEPLKILVQNMKE